jgi:hypothetical protein
VAYTQILRTVQFEASESTGTGTLRGLGVLSVNECVRERVCIHGNTGVCVAGGEGRERGLGAPALPGSILPGHVQGCTGAWL